MNLDQFKNWALGQGQVGKFTDGLYVGQCVSLINQYLGRVYGISAGAWGNAADWANNGNVNQYFDHVGSPQAGDIGVMGTNYGGGYGHIFIYTSPSTILEQNGRVPLKVTTGGAYANPIAILRRKGTTPGGGTVSASQDTTDETAIRLEYNNAFDRDAADSDVAAWRGQNNEAMQRGIGSSLELAQRREFTNKGRIAVRDNWEGQISHLTEENAAKQANIDLFQGYINDRDKIIADQGHQIGEQATQIAGQADQIKTLTGQVSDLTKQVKDLKAQIAAGGSGEDSVQLNALGAALKWFIARLGLK